MKIYFKGGNKYKTLKGLLKGYIYTKNIPNTYLDPNCNILQHECERVFGERPSRNVDVYLEMAKTYFPSVTDEEVIKTLSKVKLKETYHHFYKHMKIIKRVRIIFCPDILKPVVDKTREFKGGVFNDDFDFIECNWYGNDLSVAYGRHESFNEESKYSLNELKEMFNN
jgi:hypothetical protein